MIGGTERDTVEEHTRALTSPGATIPASGLGRLTIGIALPEHQSTLWFSLEDRDGVAVATVIGWRDTEDTAEVGGNVVFAATLTLWRRIGVEGRPAFLSAVETQQFATHGDLPLYIRHLATTVETLLAAAQLIAGGAWPVGFAHEEAMPQRRRRARRTR